MDSRWKGDLCSVCVAEHSRLNELDSIGIGDGLEVLGIICTNGPLSVREGTESIVRTDFISIKRLFDVINSPYSKENPWKDSTAMSQMRSFYSIEY